MHQVGDKVWLQSRFTSDPPRLHTVIDVLLRVGGPNSYVLDKSCNEKLVAEERLIAVVEERYFANVLNVMEVRRETMRFVATAATLEDAQAIALALQATVRKKLTLKTAA